MLKKNLHDTMRFMRKATGKRARQLPQHIKARAVRSSAGS